MVTGNKKIAILAVGFILAAGLGLVRQYVSHMKQSVAASKAKFESVHRAGIAVEAATKVGVNYAKFQDLVQSFALEVSVAQEKAETEDEQMLAKSYAGALGAYQDSLTVWALLFNETNLGWKSYGVLERDEVIVYDYAEPIVLKYHLTTKPWRLERRYGRAQVLNAHEAIHTIWYDASVKLSVANAVRNSQHAPNWMKWVP